MGKGLSLEQSMKVSASIGRLFLLGTNDCVVLKQEMMELDLPESGCACSILSLLSYIALALFTSTHH